MIKNGQLITIGMIQKTEALQQERILHLLIRFWEIKISMVKIQHDELIQ